MRLDIDLYDAVSDGNEERVKRLLAQGVDPNAVATHIGESNMRPILVAAHFFPFLIEPLVAAGARLGREYHDAGSGRMLGPVNFAAREETGEAIAVLARLGVDVRENSDALFEAAIRVDGEENIRRLIRWGADPEVRVGTNRNTPLLIASYFGQVENARALIELGASMEACDFRGNTPLRFAVHQGYIEVVELLLEAGAKLDAAMLNPEHWEPSQAGKPVLAKTLRLIGSHMVTRGVIGAMPDDEPSGSSANGRPDVGIL